MYFLLLCMMHRELNQLIFVNIELSWPTTGPPARLPLICFCRSLEWSLMGNNITELKGTSLAGKGVLVATISSFF